jgi:hypothetical protein
MISKQRILLFSGIILVVVTGLAAYNSRKTDAEAVDGTPTAIDKANQEPVEEPMTMADVLDLARDARKHLAVTLDDYTTHFVKQDRDKNGVLNEQEEMFMKVQTRLRGDSEDAPLRVYMKFDAPESKKGREVIWGEDLNDGKLCVHEAGLLGLKRLHLVPTGFLAMQGQRYPISTVGMVRLVEKLIERGEKDRDNPNIKIDIVKEHQLGDVTAELLQIHCSKPRGGDDDFSLAEVVIDRERMLILMFRSFGWPDIEGEDAPLLESYTYHDVKTNVGLTDEDFIPDNPEYNYPSF